MDSFHIWYKWSLAWEGMSYVTTFDLDLYLQGDSTLFWLGIQHDSIVWVIMRRRRVSSQRRRSSCSSSTWVTDCQMPIWNSDENSDAVFNAALVKFRICPFSRLLSIFLHFAFCKIPNLLCFPDFCRCFYISKWCMQHIIHFFLPSIC